MKELVRPYYLKWLYFPLVKDSCPPHFKSCWKYPSCSLGPAVRSFTEPQGALPDVVFLPQVDWHTRIQRPQQLARAFASLGHRCIYLNPHLGREFSQPSPFGPSEIASSISPGVIELHVRLPREPVFHHRRLRSSEVQAVRDSLRQLLKIIDSRSSILIVGLPLWTEVAIELRRDLTSPIVYDCHDLLEGFRNMGEELVSAERALLETSDLVAFSAEWLEREHAGELPSICAKSLLVRNAVDPDEFHLISKSAASQGPPVIGYMGALNFWFDVNALKLAAQSHPEWSFVLIGRQESPRIDELRSYANVQLVGEVPHAELPRRLSEFDIGIIPFERHALTMATNPVKLYEYFACGLPVVSSTLPEVERYRDLLYLASTPEEFVHQLELAVRESDPAIRAKRRRVAETETWVKRCEDLCEALRKVRVSSAVAAAD